MVHEGRRSIALWSLLVFLNVSGTAVAVELYGAEFRFWQDPFSALGGRYTMDGTDNLAGMIALMATMLLSGLVLLSLYRVEREVEDEVPRFMRALLLVGGIGYLIAAVPYDVVHFLHSLGSGMAVATLYGWSIYFLLDLAELLSHPVVTLMHGALHWAVLSYAVLFAIGEPAKQGVQKAAFLMLLFTLMTAVFAERRIALSEGGCAGEGKSVAEAREVDYSDGTED